MTRILITGARGAIGQHVVALARSRGHKVIGIGHGAWGCAEAGEPELPRIDAWVNGGITADNLDAIAAIAGLPDIVVHLAGGSLVGASIHYPGEDFRRTVESAHHMMEWMRIRAPDAKLVIASSAAVYGNAHAGPIDETAPFQPASPYGTHKAIIELLARCYACQFGLAIAVVRLFSVYGPGLRKQLIWELANRLLRGERQLTLGGTGNELRDFLHIDDAAAVLLDAAGRADRLASAFNGCTGVGTTIAELARLMTTGFPGVVPRFSGQSRPGDPFALVGKADMARAAGLEAKRSVADGLQETLNWIKSQRSAEERR